MYICVYTCILILVTISGSSTVGACYLTRGGGPCSWAVFTSNSEQSNEIKKQVQL